MLNLLGTSVDWRAEKRAIADEKLLDLHTEIYDGYAYLFIRDIVEQVEKNIEWYDKNKTVIINMMFYIEK